MKFESPTATNPIDQLKVIGRATDRIDGPLKTTGTAPYAYERHNVAANQAYGCILGSAIAKGRIDAMDTAAAKAAPGVLKVLTTLEHPKLEKSQMNVAQLFGGSDVQHYHQAIALVVAESFEQARAAATLIKVSYTPSSGKFDLEAGAKAAPLVQGEDKSPPERRVGDFEAAFNISAVKLDQTYTTPDESHAMMEPHASIAEWKGDKLTLWT
ncbi:MAG: xanthine dehydrogenase family protein molybdopterin-binding subunit, partial [Oxalobacteraceae bacterium]